MDMENLNSIIEAANNGDAVSQYKLARAYESGDGVDKNLNTARKWYQQSANSGYKNAEVKLRLLSTQVSDVFEPDENTVVKQAYQAPSVPAVIQPSTAENGSNPSFNTHVPPVAVQQKSKVVAALLAWLLGSFGVHDFYLGYKKNGIIKIILTVTVIGSVVSVVWSLVDFIKIICNGKFDSNGQPLK